MSKSKCNPPHKVSIAAKKLATSQSSAVKSNAARKLANHRHENH